MADGICDGNISSNGTYAWLDTGEECGGENIEITGKFVGGCLASMVGTVCLNLGINLQKYGLTYEGKRPAHLRRPMVKNPRWIFGFVVFLVSNLGDFVGLSMAPQTVIMAVGTVSIVSNMIFGRCAWPSPSAPPSSGAKQAPATCASRRPQQRASRSDDGRRLRR